MSKYLPFLCALGLLLAACGTPPPPSAPAPDAFPTVTPGRLIAGPLPTVIALPLDGLANPATAVALANRPSPTPDYAACPPAGSPTLSALPATSRQAADEVIRFLSAGGSPQALSAALQSDWGLQPDTVSLRAGVDLTGAGTPAVAIAYAAPEGGSTVLALVCAGGRYTAVYEAATEGAAQIIHVGDINLDQRADLLYAATSCENDNACSVRAQLLTWDATRGRLISLLGAPITGPNLPMLADLDGDGIQEIAMRLSSTGTAETGPLRTGVTIYDWDGSGYALSITQFDPPRFRVQVIHEADRSLLRLEVGRAIEQYALALSDTGLRNWYNDDPPVLNSYALYRLLTAYAYAEDERLLSTYQTIVQTYPDPASAPVYALMAQAFWNAFQSSNNLRSACAAVQDIITARPEALGLLNRYGSRSPTYTANDLCPF